MIKRRLLTTAIATLIVAGTFTACGKKNTAVDADNTSATTKAVVQEQTTKSQTEATTTTEPTNEEAATEAETATEEITEATEAVEVAVNDTQEDTEAPVETPVEEPVYADTLAQPTPEPQPQPDAPAPDEKKDVYEEIVTGNDDKNYGWDVECPHPIGEATTREIWYFKRKVYSVEYPCIYMNYSEGTPEARDKAISKIYDIAAELMGVSKRVAKDACRYEAGCVGYYSNGYIACVCFEVGSF